MNTNTYTSGNPLLVISYYTYDQNEERLKEVLSESVVKIKGYLSFKERLNDEERQFTISKPYMSLPNVCKIVCKTHR